MNELRKAIELEHVSFSYEDSDEQVLRNASMEVCYGEVALLCGFSGEGKSTVLSLISGIIPDVTPGEVLGRVRVDGEDIAGKKLSEICRKVGVVLQNADAQIIQQIVEDEVAFGCENFAVPREEIGDRILRACGQMELDPSWKTRTLSGGQKQRLITAAAFATGQRILVLDEPLANLDKEGAAVLMRALRTLARKGYAVLLVEHRLDIVLSYVDTVFSIRAGEITRIENRREFLASQAKLIRDTCEPETEQRDGAGDGSVEPIFSVHHVGVTFGKRQVLKDVDFEISKGERLLLLGQNGCGKTTLLRLLARLAKPVSGDIIQRVQMTRSGKPVSATGKPNREWFRKVGIVYQNPNYQLFMPTVFQEIAFGAVSEDYAREIMEQFGIAHLAKRHPHSLSEGQKRRVSIAAVAASRPEVLLLDEPTVGQDYRGLQELVEILNRMHRETGNTMITITHDMRCAEALCDHAVLIEEGKVASEGGKELVHRYFLEGVISDPVGKEDVDAKDPLIPGETASVVNF